MSERDEDEVEEVDEVDVRVELRRRRKARRRRAKARRKKSTSPEDQPSEGLDQPSLREHLDGVAIAALPHQRRLALGGSMTIVGLALVGSTGTDIGAIVVIAGLLTLMYAIHRYGRLGAER